MTGEKLSLGDGVKWIWSIVTLLENTLLVA